MFTLLTKAAIVILDNIYMGVKKRSASVFLIFCLGVASHLQGQNLPQGIVRPEPIATDVRSNRVKSCSITHAGLKEAYYQTVNEDTVQDGLNGEPSVTLPISRRTLFAVKTNLLYDLTLTPNLELEIPIGRRWSINAEYQYGWWLRKDNTFCWQIEAGGLEGRYWLGNREKRDVLTGWFVGLFSSGGMYDFQLKKDEGRQGEFYIMAGASAGYALPIARNLHMEFSTGFGALVTNYRRYRVIDDELIKQGKSMKYKALLPLKAKISLVWTIKGKKEAKK